jgi:hypothetical protein
MALSFSKIPSCFYLKQQRLGDWLLSRSSGKPYSVGHSQLETETESSLRNIVFLNKNRTVDNVQKHNFCKSNC